MIDRTPSRSNSQTQTLYSELNTRIVRLEDWKASQDVSNAVAAEHRRHIVERFDGMEGRLDKIDGHMTWIVRLIGGALILAVVGFLLAGGGKQPSFPFNVPQEYRGPAGR